jgi:formylglycine-generating enzyme required for sulfatase activity
MRVLRVACLLAVSGCVRFGYTDANLQTPDADSFSTADAGPDAGGVPGDWVSVAAGTFVMGSPTSEPCRKPPAQDDEAQHTVTLTRRIEIQTTEVTQAQFQAVMGYNPSTFTGCPGCPVEWVTWHEAAAYCNALSALAVTTGCYLCSGSGPTVTCGTVEQGDRIYACAGYRLPTEAEWEHAYRAGTQTALYSGDTDGSKCTACDASDPDANADSIGWFCANAGGETRPVAQKQANAWGLFDMAGNVWEWCHDWYQADLGTSAVTDPVGSSSTETEHVARGGCWMNNTQALRAAYRQKFGLTYRNNGVGFRCARTLSGGS